MATDRQIQQTASPSSRWADLPTAAQAKKWEEVSPGTFERIMKAVELAERHDRLMDWADLSVRILGLLCGLSSVVILALLAKYFSDHGATATALTLFGVSTASMVSVFVTNRSKNRHLSRRIDPLNERQ